MFTLRCSTVWSALSGDVLPLLIPSTPAASYSCYSEHIAPLGPLPHPHPRFLPCPCAPSIQSSQPLHLLPWRLMLATARPSGWSILADCSPLFDEGCQHADYRGPTHRCWHLFTACLASHLGSKWVLIWIMYSDNLCGSLFNHRRSCFNLRGFRSGVMENEEGAWGGGGRKGQRGCRKDT